MCTFGGEYDSKKDQILMSEKTTQVYKNSMLCTAGKGSRGHMAYQVIKT